MEKLIDALRQVLGEPYFWKQLPSTGSGYSNYQWDYGAMLEYMLAGALLIVVIASVFKFIRLLIK